MTLGRNDVIHFNGPERVAAGKRLCELLAQACKFKGAIPESVKWDPLRLIARDPEQCVESTIARLDSLVSVQHDERISDRVEDRLRAFAFVNCLIHACAESSHVGEGQHGAGDLAITSCVRGYPNNEPLVPVAKIGPGFDSAGDDLAASLFQPGQASERRDIAHRPTKVRCREAEHIRRRLIEASDHKVAL